MTSQALLRELNQDVWEPFRSAYRDLDAAGFLALHGPDLIRVTAATGEIRDHAGYTADITSFFERVAANGDAIAIEFRFTERNASDGASSERGLFRITMRRSGVPKEVHGHFHVFCRKTDRWRIAVDYEPDEDDTATAGAFAAAAAQDDLAAFDR
ncbi:YybH family protein [Actinosynnema sp. NPDC059797]